MKKPVVFKTAKLGRYKDGTKAILIKFPFNYDTIQQVKTIPGRKFNSKSKYWHCPYSQYNVTLLLKYGFKLSENLHKQQNIKYKPINIPGLRDKPRKFQSECISFAHHKNHGVIFGDEMGLGKTVEALGYLELHKEYRPAVILCNSSSKYYWERMAENWLSSCNTQVLSGRENIPIINKDIIILNYDILADVNEMYTDNEGKKHKKLIKGSGWVDRLIKLKPKIIILDEIHLVKNEKSNRSIATDKLCKKAKKSIGLTGTLMDNKTIDIWNPIRLVHPKLFPNYWAFAHKFCDAKHNGYGWDFSGSSNEDELHEILKTVMIRHLKKDVEKQIPPKDFSFVPLDITNREEYEEAKNNFTKFLLKDIETKLAKDLITFGEKYGVEQYDFSTHVLNREKLKQIIAKKISKNKILQQLNILKQLTAKGKLKNGIEWIEDFLKSGKKLVIFTYHVKTMEALYSHFKNIAVKIDGSVRDKKRQESIDQFQNNSKIKLMFGQIIAAGTSITLTAASDVAFFELPWTPGKLNQAIDRCHRIGQKYRVVVHYLLALNTIEERIAKILSIKAKRQSKIIDGMDYPDTPLLINMIENFIFETNNNN